MKKNYSWQQIALHWLSAIIIIWAMITGFYITLFEPALEHKQWVAWVNVSLTTLYIPFFILRIWYALHHGKPSDNLLNHKEERLAAAGHFLLYANIAAVLLTGVLMMERPIGIFSLFYIPQPISDTALTNLFRRAHIISCITLSLLVIGHIFAVIKHQRAGKPLLRRMSW